MNRRIRVTLTSPPIKKELPEPTFNGKIPYLVAAAVRGPDSEHPQLQALKWILTARIRAAWFSQTDCQGYYNGTTMPVKEYRQVVKLVEDLLSTPIVHLRETARHFLLHLRDGLLYPQSKYYFGKHGVTLETFLHTVVR